MHLNSTFIANVHDVYGQEAGDQWLKQLPSLIDDLARHWGFQFLQTMPNLSYSFVGLVQLDASAKLAVLKMVPENGNIAAEINWLKCIEHAVPTVYFADEKWNAFVMEYLQPGTLLKDLVITGDDETATKIICQTIRNLQNQRQSDYQFQPLSNLSEDLAILHGRFDARLLSQAISLFRDLTIDKTPQVLLHSDLHHDNILASGTEWKAIDPHGYVGDPAAEVGAMIRNPMDCFPAYQPLQQIVERRLKIMADELPFDGQRMKAWAFCMTVLSAAWTFEGHKKVTEFETDIAIAINKVKL